MSFLDYSTYDFVTLVHCVTQSERPEAVPHVLDWMKIEFGEHVFNPSLVVVDGNKELFDMIHTCYSKYVSICVPLFGYVYQLNRELKMRSIPRSPMTRVLMLYLKLLAFVPVECLKNRYAEIKRIF